ncbi:MAG: oxidoreductase [Lachnospiraceae bacterium]|nr:oxidoreductase [Lachnospiraceae bacterium]
MRQAFKRIPVYTGDVSGVCSALFELGGMVVMHDPSGCNSTYNTHDEIRWYDQDSLIFISGLNEMEAIMGSDEDLIRDITESARIYSPKFIAIANSPIPYITGMDFDAISRLIEEETGIPTFYISTNGMHDYTRGAGLAFLHLAERFVKACPPDYVKNKKRCNILGFTPLDFASQESLKSLRAKISAAGLEILSCWAMGDTLEQIEQSACADVNLVVSSTGLRTAQYMHREFGIPFVAGIPAECTEDHYFQAVQEAVETGENQFPFRNRSYPAAHADVVDPGCMPVCLIGEPVIMTSLAASAELLTGAETHVFGATEDAQIFLGDKDAALSGEEELEEALRKMIGQVRIQDSSIEVPSSNSETTDAAQEKRGEKVPDCVRVVADPYYRFVFPDGCGLIPLPHLAFSGRIFLNEIPDLIRFSW